MSGSALVNNRFLPHAQPPSGGDTFWERTGNDVSLVDNGNTVTIGADAPVGGEKVRIVGALRVEGQLLGDSIRAEDTSGGTNAFLELDDGATAADSAVGEARIRYNDTTAAIEVSANGGAYTSIFAPSGGGWTDDGAIVRLTTSTDDVVIGLAAKAGTEKVRVTGGASLWDGVAGAVPVSGAGTRMMWVPASAALRAGVVTGTAWDAANVGANSVAFGSDTIASGAESVALCDGSEAPAAHSVALGEQAQAARIGQLAQSNGFFVARGDSQSSTLVLRRQTPDATVIDATLNGAAPAGAALNTSNRIILEDSKTYVATADIIARNTGASEHRGWQLQVVVKRDVGVATTALVGTQIKTKIGRTVPAANTWDVDFLADAVNGALRVALTGQAGKTINWTARLTLTEVA